MFELLQQFTIHNFVYTLEVHYVLLVCGTPAVQYTHPEHPASVQNNLIFTSCEKLLKSYCCNEGSEKYKTTCRHLV
jgi:hypothetical protein